MRIEELQAYFNQDGAGDISLNGNKFAGYYTIAEITTLLGNKQPFDGDLADIAGLSPVNNDVIQRKAGAWANRTPEQVKADLAYLLDELSDVVITTPANGNVLVYNSTLSQWVNAVPVGGGGSTSITAVSVNTGTIPRIRQQVTVTDALVTPTSKLIVSWGTVLDTDTNDPEMDDVIFKAIPAAGSFDLVITSAMNNFIAGVFKINYLLTS